MNEYHHVSMRVGSIITWDIQRWQELMLKRSIHEEKTYHQDALMNKNSCAIVIEHDEIYQATVLDFVNSSSMMK